MGYCLNSQIALHCMGSLAIQDKILATDAGLCALASYIPLYSPLLQDFLEVLDPYLTIYHLFVHLILDLPLYFHVIIWLDGMPS